MRVAITGAGGFTGKILCEALMSRGHQLTSISLRDLTPDSGPDEHQAILSPIQQCDVLINAAAAKSIQSVQDEFINSALPVILAKLPSVSSGHTRFVHISSMNVAITELTDPYTRSKRKAETGLTGLPVTIIRPGLIWSFSGGDAGQVVRIFQSKLPILPVPWPGNSYRPIMVEDFVSWICHAVEDDLKPTIIEILGSTELTMWDLLLDLSRRHDGRLLPVPTNWLPALIPPLKKLFFANSRLQQMMAFNRGVASPGVEQKVNLPFPDLSTGLDDD